MIAPEKFRGREITIFWWKDPDYDKAQGNSKPFDEGEQEFIIDLMNAANKRLEEKHGKLNTICPEKYKIYSDGRCFLVSYKLQTEDYKNKTFICLMRL